MTTATKTTIRTPRVLHRTTELACKAESARAARTWVRQLLASQGVSEQIVAVAVQLTSELVANAAQWTGCKRVRIRLRMNDQRLRIDVEDGSRSLPARLPADCQDENGRGLNLIDALADRWGADVQPCGKAVWFELHATGAAARTL